VSNKIKKCQWKCIHNIIYAENRLQKMNMSNGKCHLCQVDNNNETLQHLFFQCPSALEIPRTCREKDIMLGYHEGDNLDNIINIIIYIFYKKLCKHIISIHSLLIFIIIILYFKYTNRVHP
jgi:hypothetical protein